MIPDFISDVYGLFASGFRGKPGVAAYIIGMQKIASHVSQRRGVTAAKAEPESAIR